MGGEGGGAGKSKEEGGCQRGDFKPLTFPCQNYY